MFFEVVVLSAECPRGASRLAPSAESSANRTACAPRPQPWQGLGWCPSGALRAAGVGSRPPGRPPSRALQVLS